MNFVDGWQGNLDGGSARRKAATYTAQRKQIYGRQICMFRVRFRTRDPSVWTGEDISCLRPRGHFIDLLSLYFNILITVCLPTIRHEKVERLILQVLFISMPYSW
jgi:hypothetical protein